MYNANFLCQPISLFEEKEPVKKMGSDIVGDCLTQIFPLSEGQNFIEILLKLET